jgi:hypothetical protein
MSTEEKKETGRNAVSDPDNKSRFNIAKWVLIFGLISVSVLGIVAILFTAQWSDDKEKFSNVKDILTMVLPLIGAWVGTVLAFYFSKENFKAASDSTKDLFREFKSSEEKLKKINVADVMIKADAMVKLIISKEEKLYKLKEDIIDGILEKDKKNSYNRLPVLSDNLYPKYIIHRSWFDKFLVKMTLAGKKIEGLTLADMSADPDFTNDLTACFGTIKESSNLAEVKHLIDSVPNCQDVFITESGDTKSKVIGWITNVIVAKASVI